MSPTGAPRSARIYTMTVADVLAEIAPETVDPSIQTAPLGFKPNVTGPEKVAAYTAQRAARRGPPERARASAPAAP